MKILVSRLFVALVVAVVCVALPGKAEPPAWSGNPDAELVVKTLPGMMRYDASELTVKPGARVKLTLENPDDLQHNLVVLKEDPKDRDGQKFAQNVFTSLGDKAIEQGWVPRDDPRVIAATQLLDPKAAEAIYFVAPDQPGEYPYVCTVPGHSLLMRGMLQVRDEVQVLTDLTYSLYEGQWDKLPDFSKLEPVKTGELPAGKIDLAVANHLKGGFGIEFEGKLNITAEEDVRFYLASDDGSRVIVDGEGIVDNDGIHAMGNPKEGMVRLQEGTHTIRVPYFERSGQRGIILMVRSKSLGWQGLSAQTAKIKAKKAEPKPILLTPGNGEAITHRAFLPGTNPRGIAIGYPGGVNVGWDADVMNVAMVWRGGFLNVAPHWNGRGSGSQPSGYDLIKTGHGFPFQQLESLDEPWLTVSKDRIKYERDNADPQKEISFVVKNPDYQFTGYRLDPENRYPTFRYRYREAEVEDRFEPAEIDGREAIVRHLAIKGSVGEETWFRVADTGNLEMNDGGWYQADGKLWVKVEGGGEPVVRRVENKPELIVPLEAGADEQKLKVTYWWQTAIGGRVKP